MSTPAGTALTPCLADLLRTCVHPPSLVLRVEHVFGKAHAGSRGNAVDGLQEEEQNLQGLGRLEGAHVGDSGVWTNESETTSSKTYLRSEGHKPPPTRPPLVHLALSDDHLQLQAVLPRNLHACEELLKLQVGDILTVKRFEVRSAPRLNGRGRVVYLRVRDCVLARLDHGITNVDERDGLGIEEGGFLCHADVDDKMSTKNPSREERQSLTAQYRSWSKKRDGKPTPQGASQSAFTKNKPRMVQDADSDDDGFDTLAVAQSQIDRRREALRQIQSGPATEKKPTSRLTMLDDHSQAATQKRSIASFSPLRRTAKAEEADCQEHFQGDAAELSEDVVADSVLPGSPRKLSARQGQTQSLPFSKEAPQLPQGMKRSVTTLSSLLAVPTQKSYPCPPLFVLISWVSPSIIHRPNTPFPPKRHLKIHDPSICNRISGLTVAVFVDALAFLPEVGTPALFRGLVMNRVRNGEDVILNRYPLKVDSQKAKGRALGDADSKGAEEDWFISDEWKLIEMGYDVEHMKQWWHERNASRKDGERRDRLTNSVQGDI
ncbi:hypothetical protein G647_06337 [Cladophialophora carrionii CBS 160.54]|uniref:Uncharacterized protein n=1 Tax=Cladophialophora carrionii CBS 160.54 TaxID=1279043 RepID=V9D5T7_9EURO|nr:uncharacterized protein G647_06337 [Cladophialophora carrionii CBS 160.54]ETI22264.1 hypothetical protein G647_06337 [Cladophialophora carrionii CBS 160.54]